MDGLTARFLKSCIDSVSLPLSLLMTASMHTGIVPKSWLSASVTPIFKKGDKLHPSNYRPISLAPLASKLMESIVCQAMTDFLLSHDVIPGVQHGFIPGRSVITNLLQCVNDWTTEVDRGGCMDVIYLDFSKAFDRVPRRRLLKKLEHVGIRGELLRWIQAFLSDRSFCVRVDNVLSSSRPVISGVPQGSVLGPLLFLVYVADLPTIFTSKCSFYADDTKIYANPVNDYHQLLGDLDALHEWCLEWMLPLNLSKCVVLHIGKNNPKLQYFLGDVSLSSVDHYNDLGVIVSSDLTWSSHIASVCKRANTKLYLIKKAFAKLSFASSIKLYTSYVRPLLEFAGPVWSVDFVRDRKLLESVQRYATRISFGMERPSYENRLGMAGLRSFEKRRLRGDLILTFKILKTAFSSDLSNLFILNNDERLRGHSMKLKQQRFFTTARRNFLPNRIFLYWNILPTYVIDSSSVNMFKNKLDLYLDIGLEP